MSFENGKPMTLPKLLAMKGKQKIVCVTAYDEPFARIADSAGVDIILVGDSMGMAVLGMPDTLGVSLEMVEHHTQAVRRGVKSALVVADLPFGSYGSSVAQAVDSSVRLVKAGASAVKLEGSFLGAIIAIQKVGIPVMGHVGMTPQSHHIFGGFKLQGKQEKSQDFLRKEAKEIAEAGAFSIVLELIPGSLARQITEELVIPTIGIGAGSETDGQIQVLHDILGFTEVRLKHSKVFGNIEQSSKNALVAYAEEVRNRTFPSDRHGFE